MRADVGNLRVSSSAVEFDILIDSKEAKEQAVSLLVKNLGDLLTVRELDSPSLQNSEEAIRAGISLFNEERYWESHESFEVCLADQLLGGSAKCFRQLYFWRRPLFICRRMKPMLHFPL